MILFTSPEAQLLISSATNPTHWTVNEEGRYLAYQVPGLPGTVQLDIAITEDFDAIATRLRSLQPSASLVIAWALSELIEDPREAITSGTTKSQSWALSRIVQEALGTDPWKVSNAKRAEMLQQVADALWLASRARVECQRPGTFHMGGDRRETLKIAAAPLLLQRLDTDAGGVPRVVCVALSRAWIAPLTETRAQYLPVGNTFARLSSGRAPGALARSVALWVVSQCRIHREDALGGTMKSVTPREILQRFGAGEASDHRAAGSRLLDAWSRALTELASVGLISPHPDADPEVLRSRLGTVAGGRGGSPLLDTQAPPILPGPVLIESLEALEKCGHPLKVQSSPPKSVELDPEKCRAGRGESDTKRKEKSAAASEGGASSASAPPFRKRRPCPACGAIKALSAKESSQESRAVRRSGATL